MSKSHVHFVGIGGSGMSAVAMIAKAQGFKVTGCDLQSNTPYLSKLKKAKVKLFKGHDPKHLKGVDIVAVSAALFYQNKDHPEIRQAKTKTLMQWQEFMGKYLQNKKRVICITGTHGKSTTTSMVGLLYEEANCDPTVEVGAKVAKWNSNFRIGKGKEFVNEADEFYGNFLNYNPNVIILNNIEFDHPDYFTNETHVTDTFIKFIERLKGEKLLIINQDSKGIAKMLAKLNKKQLQEIKLIGYTLKNKPIIDLENSFKAKIISKSTTETKFEVTNKTQKYKSIFKLKIPGDYNVSNALGVIALANHDEIADAIVSKVLSQFVSSGRRLELIGEKNGVKVYDDYAHHPTEIRASLSGLAQMYPKNRIICVVEPHMYSRTKILLHDYRVVFNQADKVIIAPIFKSRDKETFGISSQSIVDVVKHKDITATNSVNKTVEVVRESVKSGDVVVVMGAGDSYKIAKEILIHPDEVASWEETMDILSDKKLVSDIIMSEKELKSKKTVSQDKLLKEIGISKKDLNNAN